MTPPLRRMLGITVLILAGEAAFFLPFVLARVFRPTFLAVFELNNFELGLIFSGYGTVALAAYLFGGPLADRFPAGKLMGVSLALTAGGGLYMAQFPDFSGMQLLFAFWGMTTILLFWAALIRATREWGGLHAQGKAFGLLDGGRGLVAAGLSTLLVLLFAGLLPVDSESASLAERTAAFRKIIYLAMAYVMVVGSLCWVFLRSAEGQNATSRSKLSLRGAGKVLRLPTLWLQALIILCAYVGYKATDDFSLYAHQVMNYNEVEAAAIGTLSFWVRPLVGLLAGLIADRRSASLALIGSFALVFLGALGLGSGMLEPGMDISFILIILVSSTGIFALRGLYFAITQEGKIPLAYTGTAIGIISIIGYTPDIFFGPLMGYLLDANPGTTGHHYVFLMLAGFALLGMLAGMGFRYVNARVTPVSFKG